MRHKLFLLVALSLVCLFPAPAQTVIESGSSLVFNEKTAEVALAIENPGAAVNEKIRLELLDAAGGVRAAASQNLNVRRGREIYKIDLPVGDLPASAENEIAWFRLRYRIGKAEGIVSLSELIKDAFELRVAASENVLLGTTYRARVRAVQPLTNTPVKNVRITGALVLEIDTEADEDEIEIKTKGETDGDGFAVLDFKVPENIKLEDIGDFTVTGRKNGIVREFETGDLEVPDKEGSLFLTADKPLYQPGQSFNVRALYFDRNSTVVADAALEFTVKDEDDTALYRETVKTSVFGIASIAWKIPDNAKLGAYRVEVETEEDVNGDQLYFKVSRYDLPQFVVVPKPDKTFYLPGQKQAEITVRADYLFGKPVTSGKVRVVQESSRRWDWRTQKYDVEEKQAFEGDTDAEGKYVAKVDLSGEFGELLSSEWERFQDVHFSAYFTDLTTNRTEQRRFDVRLTKESIHIYFIGKYDEERSPGLPVTAYVSTFYADGTPVVCDVTIEGRNDDEDDNASFKTLQRLKTNALGAGKIEFARPAGMDASDDLELRIRARDQKGQTGTSREEIDYYNDNEGVRIETEKVIYKPGEAVKVKVLSTRKDALVYLDVVKDWSVLESRFVRLDGNGRGEVKIPYKPDFKGEVTLAAYFEESEPDGYGSYDLVKDARGIIFPEQQNLKLDAQFSAATYKPGADAKARISVLDGAGTPIESALGVVVFDKAVEERAKTDSEFGSYFSAFRGWLGYERAFGGVTLKDLNDLDLTKPVSAEMQLAAEVILFNSYYRPQIYRSGNWETNAQSVYADYFKKQLAPLEDALKKQFEKTSAYPSDDASLRKILRDNAVDFDQLRDPWGNAYQTAFAIDKAQLIVTLKTAGADKKFGTRDDFTVSSSGFAYFTATGKAITKAAADYHARTGGYIRDLPTLKAELARLDVDFDKIKDYWNRDYRTAFEVAGRSYVIRVYSLGANGYEEPTYYGRDDFDVWRATTDYFAEIDLAINRIFSQTVNGGKREFPRDDAEFKKILKENGLDLAQIKDGYGQLVYVAFDKTARYADKTTVENGKQKITPVTEEVLTFRIRSTGENRATGADDFDLTTISGVLSEQSKDTKYETKGIKTIAYSGTNGALRGTISDPTGAVVPGAEVTATSVDGALTRSVVSRDDGTFLFENIPPGTYNVRINAAGFKSSLYTNIQLRAQTSVDISVTLEVGAAESVVEVTSDAEVTVNATASSIQTTVNAQQIELLPKGVDFTNALKMKQKQGSATQAEENSTPRLREYFPETLFWAPEIVTDRNGRAEVKFKMADNITTWKLYTIASTKKGKIGVAEKEVTAFQPFFVDLEPPKFLTDGDEIHLPAPVRNYTAAKQKVGVTMTKADWFSMLSPEKQTIEVASGAATNAVFGFKAITPVKDGKQRVTALAANDSDAIEKPVTVRPNGQEIVRTETKLFSRSAAFDFEFPANALPKTPRAALKIYPNLMAHVTESVEGLLQRPYGCGEQTISSTYPNLMILKFKASETGNSALEQKARKYLQKGYERLLGYQVADGGFSYWGGKSESDIALTAYALRFLSDAKGVVEVDPKVVENAQNYLVRQQRADGSFTKKYYWERSEDAGRTKLFTSYVARTLAALKAEKNVLDKALGYLRTRNAEIDEPYALALYGLSLLDAGETDAAREVAGRLEKMAIAEGDRVYWNLETNTPFYGWGTAGRIETTALVLQLLVKLNSEQRPPNAELIAKGTMFLLKNKDRYGVWYSTQTTINVLDAFLASLTPTKNQTISISVNGEKLKDVAVSAGQIEPIVLDLAGKISNVNRVEITSSDNSKVMSQLVQAHYIDWKDADVASRNVNDSRAIRLDYKCDKQAAKIMETVTCAVETERVGFKGYGMLLAEIGVPPGADVSRESLQAAMDADWSLSRYEVLPDRIVLYMWAKAGGTKFNFSFKPRYGINAQTPASIVYDYYNEEAKGTVAPLRFEVR